MLFNKLIEIISTVNSEALFQNTKEEFLKRLPAELVNDDIIVVKTRVKYKNHQHYVYVYVKYDKNRNLLLIDKVSAYTTRVTEELRKQYETEKQVKHFKELLALVLNPA